MNVNNFINGLKVHRDGNVGSILEALEKPSGRQPRAKDVRISAFYNSLTDEQKLRIKEIVEESVDMATFSFLCVLDHVSFLEDTPGKSQFEMYAVKNGERVLLNDPNNEELHNLFNELVLD